MSSFVKKLHIPENIFKHNIKLKQTKIQNNNVESRVAPDVFRSAQNTGKPKRQVHKRFESYYHHFYFHSSVHSSSCILVSYSSTTTAESYIRNREFRKSCSYRCIYARLLFSGTAWWLDINTDRPVILEINNLYQCSFPAGITRLHYNHDSTNISEYTDDLYNGNLPLNITLKPQSTLA